MIIRASIRAWVSGHRAPGCRVVAGVNVVWAVAADTEGVEGPDPGAVGARPPHWGHRRGQTRVSEASWHLMMEVIRLRGHVVITQLGPAHGTPGVTPAASWASWQFVSLRVSAGAWARVSWAQPPELLALASVAAAGEVRAGSGPGQRGPGVEAVHFVHNVGGCIILTLKWGGTMQWLTIVTIEAWAHLMRGSAVIDVPIVVGPAPCLQLRVLGGTDLVNVEVWALVWIGQIVKNAIIRPGSRFFRIDPHCVTLEIVDRRAIVRILANGNWNRFHD